MKVFYEAMPKGYEFYVKAFGNFTPKVREPRSSAKDSKEGKTADKPLAKGAEERAAALAQRR